MKIVVYPHPALRRIATPVSVIDTALKQAVHKMFEVLLKSEGLGLAANQVNLPYRLFVIDKRVFINPTVSRYDDFVEAEEGCLSLPGVFVPIKRPNRVMLSAHDLTGKKHQYNFTGLFARVVQHEYDHLNGRLINEG